MANDQRRRRIRFSLFTAMVAMSLFTLWAGKQALRARQVRTLEHEATALGGLVVHEHEVNDGEIELGSVPDIPLLLRGIIDEKWLAKPALLHLQGLQIKDADLAFLRGMTDVPTIDLSGTPITDLALEYVAMDSGLTMLMLYNTAVTDAGMEKLLVLPRLKILDIRNTLVTDRGLKTLQGLEPLEYLDVTGSKVTEDGVERFHAVRPECQIEFLP